MRLFAKGIFVLSTFLFLTFVIAGCGGGGGGGTVTPLPIDKPVALTINAPTGDPVQMDCSTTNTLAISFTADGPANKQLPYSVTWDKGSVDPAQGTTTAGTQTALTYTAPAANGSYTVTVSISNGTDVATKSLHVNVTGNVTPPTPMLEINSIDCSPSPVTPSGQAALTAVVTNPNNATLTYTWATQFGKITGSGSSITWTAPSDPGIYGIYLTVTDGTTTVKYGYAATVSGPSGGLTGQYYKTKRVKNIVQLDTLVFTRIDPEINFIWDNISPDPSKLPSTGWGAKWTGFIKCDLPGSYAFRVHVDDGARMKIMLDNGQWDTPIPNNNENWIDHDKGAWLPIAPLPMQLNGGNWYPVDLEFFQGAQNAYITLYWSINGGPEEIVPQECLKPAN